MRFFARVVDQCWRIQADVLSLIQRELGHCHVGGSPRRQGHRPIRVCCRKACRPPRVRYSCDGAGRQPPESPPAQTHCAVAGRRRHRFQPGSQRRARCSISCLQESQTWANQPLSRKRVADCAPRENGSLRASMLAYAVQDQIRASVLDFTHGNSRWLEGWQEITGRAGRISVQFPVREVCP